MFGSSFNVEHADEQPFIHAMRDVTCEALDRGTPFLGICFGAQVLAWTLGAAIEKAPVREVGLRAAAARRTRGRGPGARALRRRRHGLPVAHGHLRAARGRRALLARGDDVAQPGLPRRRGRVGHPVPLRDRPCRRSSCGPARWPTRSRPTGARPPAQLLAEADRHQAAHEAKGAETFRRFAKVAAERRVSERYRAFIAVAAYHLDGTRVARWPDGGYGVPAPYLEALRRAGARTAIVSPGEVADVDELLEPFDGLLLCGGGDVDPARYGAVPDGDHNYGVEPDRDAFEIELLRAADRAHKPDPRDLPRDAGDERGVRRDAAPAPARHGRAARPRGPARRHRDESRRRGRAGTRCCRPPRSPTRRCGAARTTTKASTASATASS